MAEPRPPQLPTLFTVRSHALSVTDTTFDVARQTSSRGNLLFTKIFILQRCNQDSGTEKAAGHEAVG